MKQFLCDYSNVIWVTSHSMALHLKTISSGFSPCCFSPRTALRAQGQDNLPLRRGSPFWSTAQIQTHVSTTLHTAGRCARTRSHPASRSGSPQYNSISKKNVTFKMGREYVETFLQRRYTNGQHIHKKIFSIIKYERNVN